MQESYSSYAGFMPQENADVMMRLKVLAGEIYKEHVYADYILRQMFPTTAVGEYLDRHAAQRGLTRKPAVKAQGRVQFFASSEEHDAILIPAGTVVCTNRTMHRYTTDSDVTLPSGQSFVIVPVTAVQTGAAYNALGGNVTVLVTPVAGIGRIYNSSLVVGGADAETDDELRARIIESYVTISNGANAAYYKRLAMSVSGVESVSVVGCARGAGTVNVYVLGANGDEVTAAQLAQVQALLTEARELNVDVLACHPEEVEASLYIRLEVEPGYDFNAVSAQVRTDVTAFINSLGVGRDLLLSEVGEVVYHTKGVRDYKFLESYGSDQIIAPSKYAYASNIIVAEV